MLNAFFRVVVSPLLVGGCLVTLGLGNAYALPRSIVGEWSSSGCAALDKNSLTIGPMSLDTADAHCSFDKVSRHGNTVTWHGWCDAGRVHHKEQTVVAIENNGVLGVSFNGMIVGKPFHRRAGSATNFGDY
jgi:hypothetical protein